MAVRESRQLRFRIGDDADVQQLLLGYICPVEVVNRSGTTGVGFANLKRIFGHPDDLRTLVVALAKFVAGADALAAADSGAGPLTGALVLHLGVPALFVRSMPKTYYLSYGSDPKHNHPVVSGERLRVGSRVMIVDDVLYSGETVVKAADVLREVGLVVSAVSCLLAAPPDRWHDRLRGAGFDSVTALALTHDL